MDKKVDNLYIDFFEKEINQVLWCFSGTLKVIHLFDGEYNRSHSIILKSMVDPNFIIEVEKPKLNLKNDFFNYSVKYKNKEIKYQKPKKILNKKYNYNDLNRNILNESENILRLFFGQKIDDLLKLHYHICEKINIVKDPKLVCISNDEKEAISIIKSEIISSQNLELAVYFKKKCYREAFYCSTFNKKGKYNDPDDTTILFYDNIKQTFSEMLNDPNYFSTINKNQKLNYVITEFINNTDKNHTIGQFKKNPLNNIFNPNFDSLSPEEQMNMLANEFNKIHDFIDINEDSSLETIIYAYNLSTQKRKNLELKLDLMELTLKNVNNENLFNILEYNYQYCHKIYNRYSEMVKELYNLYLVKSAIANTNNLQNSLEKIPSFKKEVTIQEKIHKIPLGKRIK
jgi:hypothetical protein